MYLPIEHWLNRDWNKLYNKCPYLTHDRKKEVKQILTMPTKAGVKSGEKRLMELGIVNGLGPWWFPDPLRVFLTWLFPFLDFFFHDLAYLLAESKADRLRADKGWRKYAFMSVNDSIEDAIDSESLLLLGYLSVVYLPKMLIAVIGYRLLRLFGGFSTSY